MSKITISTLTYNREHLLPRAIEHVLSQSFTDFTYLIVDNASTDSTREIIANYQKQDSRIKSIRMQENMILHPHFEGNIPLLMQVNKMLYQPAEEYHFQMDDDDYMEKDTLETLIHLIEDYQADIATVGSQWVYPDGSRKDKYVFDGLYTFDRVQAVTELLKRQKFNNAAGGKLYRKSVCNLRVPQMRDFDREYRRICQSNKMVVTGQPKYYFYRHDKNLSGLNTAAEITPQKMMNHLTSNRERTRFLQKEIPELSGFVHYCELSFMISLYRRIYRLQVTSCYAIADEMLKTLQTCRPLLPQYPWFTDSERMFLNEMHLLEAN